MNNLIVCTGCGNDTWFVGTRAITCTSCKKIKRDIKINPKDDQSKIINAMGIPSSLPNALELAQAQLDRLNKKEKILNQIENLINLE